MGVGGANSAARGDLWYFAYGSNMHPEKRAGRAQLHDLEVVGATLSGWRLAFDMPGVPPAEPSMANLREQEGATVHGVLIRTSGADFAALVASEGGDRFYAIVEVVAIRYDDGAAIRAYAFIAQPSRRRSRERPPSRRYMDLLREGARAAGLAPDYCAYLDALPTSDAPALGRLCSSLVLDLFAAASRSPLRALMSDYLVLLQATEELAPAPRLATQGVVLAPALAVGLALRAARALRAAWPSAGRGSS
jgi:cation transport regulator ChaC